MLIHACASFCDCCVIGVGCMLVVVMGLAVELVVDMVAAVGVNVDEVEG